jgi:hypothetical protein
MESILEVPTGALADVMEATGVLFTDLWVFIALGVGIPLAFYVIRRAISLAKGH